MIGEDKIRWIGIQIGVTNLFTPVVYPRVDESIISVNENLIGFKIIEHLVGVIIYVAQMYTCMVPISQRNISDSKLLAE